MIGRFVCVGCRIEFASTEDLRVHMKAHAEMRAPAELKLGATGEFSRGKIQEDDEGNLRIAVRAFPKKGIVAIDLGKKVSWLGLEKDVALNLAAIIKKQAELL